jgi:hypothetical protein
VKVKVEHGIVNLDGIVDWDYQRTEAEYDVRKLGGVKAVLNELTVLNPIIAGQSIGSMLEVCRPVPFGAGSAGVMEEIAKVIEPSDGEVRMSLVQLPFLSC